jgi:dTDP-4-dehydrorhamnose 3,5-epimerase
MKLLPTRLPDVVLIEPDVFKDPRGFFLESWSARKYAELGIATPFVQDNVSRSCRGTLRGLHLQSPPLGQGKLVYVLEGEVFDVAVDVRAGSPSFGRWTGEILSSDNNRQLYVPPGFAHGFCVLSESALFAYKCTDYYAPAAEVSVLWNDPAIGIDWPLQDPLLSKRDAAGTPLAEVQRERLPRFAPEGA